MAQAKYLQLTGNSVTGQEAAAMGWVAKSFPADDLEDQVQRELRPLAQVDPALLAANKASLNQAYELMGMRTHLLGAWQWHQLTSRDRRRAGEFGTVSREQGLRAAIDWRDGPFRREGFQPEESGRRGGLARRSRHGAWPAPATTLNLPVRQGDLRAG